MAPHCSLKKKKNLLALLHNKIHQLNLNSFLEIKKNYVSLHVVPHFEGYGKNLLIKTLKENIS